MAKPEDAASPGKPAKPASPARLAAFQTGLSAEARAATWLMAHPEHAEFDLRFDAMLIAPRRLPRHLLAAFDAST